MGDDSTIRATSFDLFGTLVAVDRPADPAAAVASELRARGVVTPDDWPEAYAEPHVDVSAGAELSLVEHVRTALESRGVDVSGDVGRESESARDGPISRAVVDPVTRAVVDAFDADVETRSGAAAAVAAAAQRGPVGLLSNCSVPGLVDRCLARSNLDREAFDAVVTSVDCGWRKPDRRAFETVADAMGVDPSALVHVGDDPATDGGADAAGASAVLLADAPLSRIPTLMEADAWPP